MTARLHFLQLIRTVCNSDSDMRSIGLPIVICPLAGVARPRPVEEMPRVESEPSG